MNANSEIYALQMGKQFVFLEGPKFTKMSILFDRYVAFIKSRLLNWQMRHFVLRRDYATKPSFLLNQKIEGATTLVSTAKSYFFMFSAAYVGFLILQSLCDRFLSYFIG